jgi:hypothetical protein
MRTNGMGMHKLPLKTILKAFSFPSVKKGFGGREI